MHLSFSGLPGPLHTGEGLRAYVVLHPAGVLIGRVMAHAQAHEYLRDHLVPLQDVLSDDKALFGQGDVIAPGPPGSPWAGKSPCGGTGPPRVRPAAAGISSAPLPDNSPPIPVFS